MTQNFKGDATELKMEAAVSPALSLASASLSEFYEQGSSCDAFLLMLYDEGRATYSNRINRETFVAFIKQAIERFAFVGNFESYIFILKEIFGDDAEIEFVVPDPGKLEITITAQANVISTALVREFLEEGGFEFFDLIDHEGDEIIFIGIAGIDSEYQLGLLFAEIMPAGIIPTIELDFDPGE